MVVVLSMLGGVESEDYFVVKYCVRVDKEEYVVDRETGCGVS